MPSCHECAQPTYQWNVVWFGNMLQKERSQNYDVELWDTKALWAGKGSSQNRPVWCSGSVLPHPHSHQQMCPSQSCILSLVDMPHSAKLATHTGVFPAGCMLESVSGAETVCLWHDTFNFLKTPIKVKHVFLKILLTEPFPSFCRAKISSRPRRGGGGQW